MQAKATDTQPLSDLACDRIALIQHRRLTAYGQYIKDAGAAKSPECTACFALGPGPRHPCGYALRATQYVAPCAPYRSA